MGEQALRKILQPVAPVYEPGHAALFALVKDVDWTRLRAALEPLGGELLAAQLDDVVIDSLGTATGPAVP